MNKKNLIRCVLRKNALICCNVWNFFSNIKQSLKKVRLNSCRTVLLYYCNRLLIELNLNFYTILTYEWCFFLGKDMVPLCFIWNFFPNVKQPIKELRLNSCRSCILYYCNRLLKNKKICIAIEFPIQKCDTMENMTRKCKASFFSLEHRTLEHRAIEHRTIGHRTLEQWNIRTQNIRTQNI